MSYLCYYTRRDWYGIPRLCSCTTTRQKHLWELEALATKQIGIQIRPSTRARGPRWSAAAERREQSAAGPRGVWQDVSAALGNCDHHRQVPGARRRSCHGWEAAPSPPPAASAGSGHRDRLSRIGSWPFCGQPSREWSHWSVHSAMSNGNWAQRDFHATTATQLRASADGVTGFVKCLVLKGNCSPLENMYFLLSF